MVTRDVWSLRFNTNFEFQENALTLLETSLSENNLFGWRKYLSVGFNMDQGSVLLRPDLLRSQHPRHAPDAVRAALFYNSRETGDYEGNSQIASLRYPLYSLASRWGARRRRHPRRTRWRAAFAATAPAGRPGGDARRWTTCPYEYRRRVVTVDANAVRSFGARRSSSASRPGYLVDRRRSEVLPDFPGDAAQAALFLAAVGADRRAALGAVPALRAVHAALRRCCAISTPSTCARTAGSGPSFRARVSRGAARARRRPSRALGLGVAAGVAAAPAGGYGRCRSTRRRGGGTTTGAGSTSRRAGAFYAATPLIGRCFGSW